MSGARKRQVAAREERESKARLWGKEQGRLAGAETAHG